METSAHPGESVVGVVGVDSNRKVSAKSRDQVRLRRFSLDTEPFLCDTPEIGWSDPIAASHRCKDFGCSFGRVVC
jgi:hypothetical protein